MKKRSIFFFILSVTISTALHAQYTADKVVGKKNDDVRDSLKTVKYPYMLPIWGQKVVNKGFNLPYSAGISIQYMGQKSDILINNLQVGFNNGPLHNLDEIVRFDKSTATSNGISIRPDFWLFPFLNIYGIFAQSNVSTAINAGIYIPDSSSAWKRIADINTKAEFRGTTAGFGITPTIGLGGYFLIIDMNFTWTDIDELDKPAYVFVFGPRLGKNFKFKDEKSLTLWVGGFRVKMNNGTKGSLSTADLFPISEWGSKIDSGLIKVANSQSNVDTWWEGLTPAEQKNPANKAKYEVANSALERAGGILNAASAAVDGAGNSSIQYSLDKRPKNMWNFLIGSQYQFSKRWMVRAEVGFLASRTQLIAGVQYRFGL